MDLYRYINEKERWEIESEKRIGKPKGWPKYFTPDFNYGTAVKAQGYLALPYAPVYRLGSLIPKEWESRICKNEDIGKQLYLPVKNRRVWAAFGNHGGGWEIVLKPPIIYEKPFYKIGNSGIFNKYLANQYLEGMGTSILNAVVGFVNEVRDVLKIVKENAIAVYFNDPKTKSDPDLPPYEYTLSAFVENETGNIYIWGAAWWDFSHEILAALNSMCRSPSNLKKRSITNYRDIYLRQIKEERLSKTLTIREWFSVGPYKTTAEVFETKNESESIKRYRDALFNDIINRLYAIRSCCFFANGIWPPDCTSRIHGQYIPLNAPHSEGFPFDLPPHLS